MSFVPDNFFSPTSSVRELHLRSSNLVSLSDYSLAPLSTSLLLLDLSDNLLTSLPAALASLTNLTHLDLSHNLIAHLDPDILIHLQSILHLDLSRNTLHQSHNLSITDLRSSLTSLSLAGNSLTRFPLIFQQNFPRLELLDLSNNKIAAVPNSFMRRTPRLSKLIMDNNQLETLMVEVNILIKGNCLKLLSDVIKDDTLRSSPS